MGDVSLAISRYINEEIKLSMTDISNSATSRKWFLDRIQNKIAQQHNSPILYASDPFVHFGSYFKGTKVKSVDEYDVLVVIDSNTGAYSKNNVNIGTGLGSANPNYKYDQCFYKSDGTGISPNKFLNWLKGITLDIVNSFGGEAPERNGQAITASIKSQNIKIDLVPCGIFRKNDGTIFYNIPKGDQGNGWIETAPHLDKQRLDSASNTRNNLKNVIRLCKKIRDNYNFCVSSFAIETAVIDYSLTQTWHNNIYHDLYYSLNHLRSVFVSGVINDPYDFENLIADVQSLDWYSKRISSILIKMMEASSAPSQQETYDIIRKAFENEQ